VDYAQSQYVAGTRPATKPERQQLNGAAGRCRSLPQRRCDVFKSLINWLATTTNTDPSAMLLICVLCTIGAYLTKDAMSNPNGAFLVYPLLVAFSILASWVFAVLGLFDMKKMESWLIGVSTASAIGMVIGLSIFIATVRGINLVIDKNT
jgi:hypothetical protein